MEKKLTDDFWLELSEKEKNQLYQFYRLLKIMARLREPDGCPWDRKQTHASLKPYLLEETYEVLEQLEKENLEGLKEELGDLLLQVVFHAQIADEEGNFSIKEVISGISDKLIRRHPHIFGSIKVENADQVLVNWNRIKAQEKKEAGVDDQQTSLLDQVNPHQPALMEAQELQAKAAEVGFDWDNIQGALFKVREELEEVNNALKRDDKTAVQEEIGDLLFAVVNVARLAGCHSELVLRQANHKFRRRFQALEKKVAEKGKKIEDLSLEILDRFWDEVKIQERK
ncbi:nucleoside triphosphate pyrophosphohydrolase [Anoxybacter fermentans]|uniref:Nucleoside triphosphate pyrophosphohydrolase n=1 Tax=Anoxybacter fermentans TaxID=1323375 RepID=A0A3Q9HS65_9FIRM|nr:nucleoside triphosphate pyrophosphohydrolase [Anoxybacter fermentans]AZR74572.1 nucleoside triphosphate pyrophosphohydrolase [Anoxybacter fermentans]